jgi:hypothetical protein
MVDKYKRMGKLSLKYGGFHRLNGPMLVGNTQYKEWFYRGFRHNLKGPAFTYGEGREEYWLWGVQFSLEEFRNKHIRRRYLLHFMDNLRELK